MATSDSSDGERLAVLVLPVLTYLAATALGGNGFVAAFVAGRAAGIVGREEVAEERLQLTHDVERGWMGMVLVQGAGVGRPSAAAGPIRRLADALQVVVLDKAHVVRPVVRVEVGAPPLVVPRGPCLRRQAGAAARTDGFATAGAPLDGRHHMCSTGVITCSVYGGPLCRARRSCQCPTRRPPFGLLHALSNLIAARSGAKISAEGVYQSLTGKALQEFGKRRRQADIEVTATVADDSCDDARR
jgi:hypothetical protein